MREQLSAILTVYAMLAAEFEFETGTGRLPRETVAFESQLGAVLPAAAARLGDSQRPLAHFCRSR